jgi:hypothetical protein
MIKSTRLRLKKEERLFFLNIALSVYQLLTKCFAHLAKSLFVVWPTCRVYSHSIVLIVHVRAVTAQSVHGLDYGLDDRGSRVRFPGRMGIFLFTTASRMALGPIQPPFQWVPGAFSLGVKRPGREADHSPPSNAEVKECVELYLHSPIRLHWMVLS